MLDDAASDCPSEHYTPLGAGGVGAGQGLGLGGAWPSQHTYVPLFAAVEDALGEWMKGRWGEAVWCEGGKIRRLLP